MTAGIRIQAAGGVLDLEIARPEKKNALTHAMYTSLAEALEGAANDGAIRVVLIHGSNTCFTAGNDLHDFLETPPSGFDSPVFRFIRGVSVFEKPLVVAVEGAAVGIGTTLLLHADLAVAGDGAAFQMPFVNLGVCPEAASSLLLPRIMGHVHAARLLLLCEAFGADEARDAGLINEVVGTGNALARAREWADVLAAKPPSAVRLAKALMRRPMEAAIADTIAYEGREFVERVESEEAKEAMTAFFEKRLPDFSRFA